MRQAGARCYGIKHVRKRMMSHVVKETREHDQVFVALRDLRGKRVDCLSGQVHDSERMLQACMRGRRIDVMGHPELTDATEPLKLRGVHEGPTQFGDLNIPVDAIFDDHDTANKIMQMVNQSRRLIFISLDTMPDPFAHVYFWAAQDCNKNLPCIRGPWPSREDAWKWSNLNMDMVTAFDNIAGGKTCEVYRIPDKRFKEMFPASVMFRHGCLHHREATLWPCDYGADPLLELTDWLGCRYA